MQTTSSSPNNQCFKIIVIYYHYLSINLLKSTEKYERVLILK